MTNHDYGHTIMNIGDFLAVAGAFVAGIAILLIALSALVEGLRRHAPRDTISAALILGFGTVCVWVTCIGIQKAGWTHFGDNTFEWLRTSMAVPLAIAIPKLAESLYRSVRSEETSF